MLVIKMYGLNTAHIIGIVLTLALIVGTGIYSGRKVKNASDFTTGGGKTGTFIIIGSIVGTLVGGASTVGTAQDAFTYGFSAWWFTIGAGLGCLFLIFFVKRLRKNGETTIQGMLAKEYGTKVGTVSSVLVSIGIFINLISQILAASSLLSSMFGMTLAIASLIVIALMAVYVIFGGVWGTGIVGIVKVGLLYIAVITAGIVALSAAGGFGQLGQVLPADQYFSMSSHGIGKDLGSCFSVILGVLSTQVYANAVLSAKSDKTAKRGSLLSAILIPPIGLGSLIIGMYMVSSNPSINPVNAFPLFIMENMPALFGGIILATLLVTIVGTGAGLALSISTIFTNDIYKKFINKEADQKKLLKVSRILIIVILIIGALPTIINLADMINQLTFLSMAFRASVIFIPLCAVLFFTGKVDSRYAFAATIAGPLSVIVVKYAFNPSFDSLVIGILVSLILVLIGAFVKSRQKIAGGIQQR